MEAKVNLARPGGSALPGPVHARLGPARRRVLVAASLVLLATASGLGLRLLRLNFQPLWWDEGYSAWFAGHSLPEMVALTAEDIHPPLYYALLHLWTQVAGHGAVSLRLLSVIFGAASIPVMYAAGRSILGSRRAGLFAALLLAISPLHVYYSQEIRMYGLVALLSTGILFAAWSIFAGPDAARKRNEAETTREPSRPGVLASLRWSWPAYVVLTTLALYTQYYAVFLPIGLTIYAVWLWRGAPRRLLAWLGAQAAVALLYLPWVLYAAPRLVLYVNSKVVADNDRPLGLLAYLGRHLSAFVAGHLEGTLAPWWPLALLLLAPLAVGIAYRIWPVRDPPAARGPIARSIPFLALILSVALLLGWLVGLRYPFFPDRGERLLLLALPPFVMLAAGGLDALWARSRRVGASVMSVWLVVAAASLVAFFIVPRYPGDDYRPLIARTVQQGLPEDTVFSVYPWQVGYWLTYGSPDGPEPLLTPAAEWGQAVEDSLDRALARGRVWFPAHLALGGGLESRIEARLAEHALPFVNQWYGPGTRLSAWASSLPDTRPVNLPGGGVRFSPVGSAPVDLVSAEDSQAPVPAANAILPITLNWQSAQAPRDLSVSVRLIDDLGQIWAQHDYQPLGAAASTALASREGTSPAASPESKDGAWQATDRLGLVVGAGTPPGRYRVETVVHPQGSERPLDVTDLAGQPLGAAARLFEVEVGPADRPLEPGMLPIGTRHETDLDAGIRFLGHSIDPAPLAPGEPRRISLFWERPAGDTGAPEDYRSFMQVLGSDGAPLVHWEADPGAAYPTSSWAPGTLIRTQAEFRVPATVSDGRYRLIAGLFRKSDGARARTSSGRDAIDLGTVTVRGRQHDRTPPAPQHPLDATFGSVARLVGYDLQAPPSGVAPGDSIPLTLYWQALGATERPYTVFVHLQDGAGAVDGYGDGEPGAGALPTTGWVAGEYLVDRRAVSVRDAGQPGEHRLVVGLYDPTTGQRLALGDGSDALALPDTVLVR